MSISIPRSWLKALFSNRSILCAAVFFTALAIHCTVSPAPVSADSSGGSLLDGPDDPDRPWHIAADRLSYDQKTGQYIGRGNAVVSKQDTKLLADFIRFDRNTADIFAAGNVTLSAGEDVIAGNRLEMNLETETGTVYEGSLFIKDNHFHISGGTLQKLGPKTYAADEATVTTCKGPIPDWKITGKNLKVTVEGVGVADHVTVWVRKAPVLYSPYIAFPVKRKRQSGFLFPRIGVSDRKGFEYQQPYFWAIDESTDATFTVHHMGKRGEKYGLEYRYIWDDSSQGAVMFDSLSDDKVDDGLGDNSRLWGYEDDGALRPNTDRYWFRMKHDQKLPLDFKAKLDLDVVSDQDYLSEFRSGYAGFRDSDDFFHKYFGRDLDDDGDAVRLNRLNLNKRWSRFSLNAETRWYDDVINRRLNDINPILQKLTFVELDAARRQIFDTPFYTNLNSEYVFFYRENKERVHRIDAHPRLYLPLNWRNYLSFEPSVGVRETFWYEDRDSTPAVGDADTFDRSIYDIRADLSSDIYRIFKFQQDRLKAVRHTIRPRVVYNFVPDKDQSDLPVLDGIDRIGENNTLTYSIINTFTAKTKKSQERGRVETASDRIEDEYDYREFCRLKISQRYDINEANENDPSKWSNPERREPFSPVNVELNMTPHRYFSLKADASQSVYENALTPRNMAVNLRDDRGDRLFVEYRYTENRRESLYVDMGIKITERLSAAVGFEKNLFDDQNIRTAVGLLYQAYCWSLNCLVVEEEQDRRFAFVVNLHGIGEFGKTFALPSGRDPVEYN